jgi:hypothetical protein
VRDEALVGLGFFEPGADGDWHQRDMAIIAHSGNGVTGSDAGPFNRLSRCFTFSYDPA